jgi:hypothetical protein
MADQIIIGEGEAEVSSSSARLLGGLTAIVDDMARYRR